MAERKIGEQKSFILYNSTGKLVNKLSDAEAGRLFKAIFDYKTDGIEPRDLTAAADMLFCSIQQYLDKDAESYRETCIKRAESGQKGGRITQQRAREKREANQANALNAKADQADIVIKDVIEDDIVNDLENEKKVKGSAPADLHSTQPKRNDIDRKRFTATVNRVYGELNGSAYSLEDCLFVFNYFLDSYEKARGEAHPPIKSETVRRIITDMPGILDEHEEYQSIEPEDYPAMIDSYFNEPFDNCDYHIQHFFSGNIRMIRYYETVFNE